MLHILRQIIFILTTCMLIFTQFPVANSHVGRMLMSATTMQNIIFKFHPFLKERTLSNGMNSLLLNVRRRKRHQLMLRSDLKHSRTMQPVSDIASEHSVLENSRLWSRQNDYIYLYENVLDVPVMLDKRHVAFETYAKNLNSSTIAQPKMQTSTPTQTQTSTPTPTQLLAPNQTQTQTYDTIKSELQNTSSATSTDHLSTFTTSNAPIASATVASDTRIITSSTNLATTTLALTAVTPITGTKNANPVNIQPTTISVIKLSRKRNVEQRRLSTAINDNTINKYATDLRYKLHLTRRPVSILMTSTERNKILFENPPTILCSDKLDRRNAQLSSATSRISTKSNIRRRNLVVRKKADSAGTNNRTIANDTTRTKNKSTSERNYVKTHAANTEMGRLTENEETTNEESATVTRSIIRHERMTKSARFNRVCSRRTKSTNTTNNVNTIKITESASHGTNVNIDRRNVGTTVMDSSGNIEISISIKFKNDTSKAETTHSDNCDTDNT